MIPVTVADAVLALFGVVVITTALTVAVGRDGGFPTRDVIEVAALNALILGLIAASVLVVVA